MNVLITGSSGFIGRNMTEKLVNCGKLDQFKPVTYTLYTPNSCELNLLNRDEVNEYVDQNHISVIVDCACWNSYVNKAKDPTLVLANNVRMYTNIMSCQHLVDRIVHLGSGAEYDRESWKHKMKEGFFGQNVPKDDYGLSKYIIRSINTASIRGVASHLTLFSVFGPYEDYTKRFISYCILKAMAGQPIEIRENRFFDFTYVDDIVRIVHLFIRDINEGLRYADYNICSGKSYELAEVAALVVSLLDSKSPIVVNNPRLSREYSGDNSRFKKDFSYTFETLDMSIHRMINYYKEYLKWNII